MQLKAKSPVPIPSLVDFIQDIMTSTPADEEAPVTSYVKVNESSSKPTTQNPTPEEWVDDKPSSVYLAKRIAILIIGLFLGFITLLPNAMAAPASELVANIGIFASFCFAAGGVMGARTSRWIWLLPGFVFQSVMFLVFFIISEQDDI